MLFILKKENKKVKSDKNISSIEIDTVIYSIKLSTH